MILTENHKYLYFLGIIILNKLKYKRGKQCYLKTDKGSSGGGWNKNTQDVSKVTSKQINKAPGEGGLGLPVGSLLLTMHFLPVL